MIEIICLAAVLLPELTVYYCFWLLVQSSRSGGMFDEHHRIWQVVRLLPLIVSDKAS